MPKHLFYFFLLVLFCPLLATAQCGPCFKSVQKIVNGNFSQGNTGFSTSLNPGSGFFCPLCPEGTYAVGSNAFFYHNQFAGTDHTTGNGNFMICNATGAAGTVVWCQTVNVSPNTDYTLSFWGRDVATNPDPHPLAKLQWRINGVLFGDTLWCEGGWQNLTQVWNSGSATSVQMCLVNWQDQTGGNDFGLDDISMTACEPIVLAHRADAGPDSVSVCSGSNLTLGTSAHAGYSYNWSPAGSGLSSYTVAQPIYGAINNGLDTLQLQWVLTSDSAAVGCTSSDTIRVRVLPLPETSLPDQLTLCPGASATLDAGQNWTQVQWNTGANEPQLTVTAGGGYVATLTSGECSIVHTTIVNLVMMPDFSMFATDYRFCEGDSVQVNMGYVGQWSDGVTADSRWWQQPAEVSYVYAQQGCADTLYMNIAMDTFPDWQWQAIEQWCEGTPMTLGATMAGQWNTGEQSAEISITQEGTYSLTVANGLCSKTDSITLRMSPLPVVVLPADTLICEEQALRLDVRQAGEASYEWSNGDSTSFVFLETAGTYSVSVTNECGTRAAEVVVDTYPCLWDVFAPNAVTPNGDGINDTWKVEAFHVQNFKVRVFNRLGNLVWMSYELDNAWTPPSDGSQLFEYVIEGVNQQGESFTMNGHILSLP